MPFYGDTFVKIYKIWKKDIKKKETIKKKHH